jgi:DNA-binding CsgD family transcriptional regulator
MAQPIRPPDSTLRVLLLAADRPTGRSYVRALERATIAVEWVRTVAELQARAQRLETTSPALVMVLPSDAEQVEPQMLADLAVHLSAAATRDGRERDGWRRHLQDAFRAYCSTRALSPRQEHVLELYLRGRNDKEIADLCCCAEATVYEHWRRMAKKASGLNKWDVVTDFHRFLAVGAAATPEPPPIRAPINPRVPNAASPDWSAAQISVALDRFRHVSAPGGTDGQSHQAHQRGDHRPGGHGPDRGTGNARDRSPHRPRQRMSPNRIHRLRRPRGQCPLHRPLPSG